MGLILDLAVAILVGVVIVSLALLAWTLAVTSVHAVRAERERIAAARQTVAEAEERLRSSAARLSTVLAQVTAKAAIRPPDGDPFDR